MRKFRSNNPETAMVSSPTQTISIIHIAVLKANRINDALEISPVVPTTQGNILLLLDLCKTTKEVTRCYGLSCY